MGLEAVPDERDRGTQLTLKMFEEVHGALCVDVGIGMQPKVQREPVAGRRDADGGNRGDLLEMLTTLMEHRSMSAHAPSAPYQRGHEQAEFVYRNEGRPQERGVFLLGASPVQSKPGDALRGRYRECVAPGSSNGPDHHTFAATGSAK